MNRLASLLPYSVGCFSTGHLLPYSVGCLSTGHFDYLGERCNEERWELLRSCGRGSMASVWDLDYKESRSSQGNSNPKTCLRLSLIKDNFLKILVFFPHC